MPGRFDAPVIGAVAFAVNVMGIGRPSLWIDEAATVSASTRSVAELWALTDNVDAVHGAYYLLLHLWSMLTPAGEFWLRLPSALLVGVAAAGVVMLGRRLSTRSVGIAAGLVFAVLPRTTWAAAEARPYALSMACAVWLTVLLTVALHRRKGWIWVGYGVALAAAAVTNVMVLLLISAHAVAVTTAPRRAMTAWLASTTAALAAVLPLLMTLYRQRTQVEWIWPLSPATAGQIFAEQYFPSVYSDGLRAVGPDQQQFTGEQLAVAAQSWLRVVPLISIIVVLTVAAVWKCRRRTVDAPSGSRLLVTVCATWILLPTALLVGYTALVQPIYQPHYLSFTTPAAALLIGCGVVVVGGSVRGIAALLALIAVAALPNYLAQRSPYAKYGSDYSQLAGLLADRGEPGQCLHLDGTLGESAVHGIEGARLLRGDGLVDTTVDETALQRDSLFASRLAGAQAAVDCDVLWVLTPDDRTVVEPGYRLDGRWQFNQNQVLRTVRDR
ncbi:glycosyltransferase family 39 protein [Mycobacterium sp. NPDC003323]